MKININNIKFVKARNMHVNPFKSTLEKIDAGYVVDKRVEGVAIIPFRHGTNGKEILIRDEYNPIRQTVLSLVRGRRDPEDGDGLEWWRATAKRELLEEAGILAEERWFSYVGELLPSANYLNTDILVIVDVTGVHQGRPITDGSIWEKKSTNFWVSIYDVSRMVKEPNQMDNYLLSGLTLFLNWCGLINPMGKSEESDLEKAKKGEQKPGHKYIRREGSPGQYKYIYTEPKAKGSKKPDEKKGKGGIMEQLVSLLGKKQGGEGEKKPKKQLPFDEFSNIPQGMPDFAKNMPARAWMAEIDRRGVALSKYDFDDADIDMMNDPENSRTSYATGLLKMLNARTQQFNVDIKIDNAKLDDNAKREVSKAILNVSSTLANIKGLTNIYNGSVAEKVFDNLSEKMKSSKFNHGHLHNLVKAVSAIKDHLDYMGRDINDAKWLQGSDPKLDWMVDSTYEAVDELMKARNRFTRNGFKFYINHLSPLVESLKDAEEMTHAVTMLENFGSFIHEAIRVSTTSRETESFANQWNMKEKDIYDSASRFYSYAAGKIVDKVRGLEALGDDSIVQNYINNLAKNETFSFLSMGTSPSPFPVGERIFSYIDTHGMDKYYRDMVFLTGGRKEKNDNLSKYYKDAVDILTKAYNGEDVYNDDDVLYWSEKRDQGIGSMKKGREAQLYMAMNTMILLNNKSPVSSKVPAFIRMWSSASHNSLMSSAVEEFVNSKRIDRGAYVNYHIASNRSINPRRQSTREALSNSINQVYKDTQGILEKDKIKLYRGNGQEEIKSVASSWTSRDEVAVKFGSQVTSVEAPKEAVLLAYDIGNDSYWTFPSEREHVLVPGLLTADKKLTPEPLPDSEAQAIRDRQLEEEANAYSGGY